MPELTAALRFIHFVASIALAGEFVYLLWVARSGGLTDRARRVAALWLAVAFVSGVLWFFVQAATMSGGAAFDAAVLDTLFGRVALTRLLLAVALAAALFSAPVSVCGLLSLLLLATLAATGHGAAEQGPDRATHLAADALHLLAAGGWLGALPGLAFALRKGADPDAAANAARRFSTLGIACVATLVATGAINTWYTVGDLPSLFGTGYGKLLLAKLALFAVMVSFAAANRLRWTPRGDFARLRRNALAETALGVGVLALVAALNVTVPALHAKIFWPFPWTLEWSALARPREVVPGMAFAAMVALALAAFGAFTRRLRTAAAGAVLLAAAGAGFAALLVVPAHPSTYFESPIPYSAPSVLRGAPLYSADCAGCHGDYGNGDGPLSDSLPRRPPNLATLLARRREGDLLWAVGHGVAGSAMPAFGERLSEDQIWDVLNFVRAQANVDEGRRMDASVGRFRPVTAPDFTFQIGRGAQESLAAQRGRYIVLLVFYSLPQSLQRLRELTNAKTSRLARMGVRVVALPLRGAPPRDAKGVDASILAAPDAGLVAAYAMFTRTIVGPQAAAPRHVEFLIDRQGYIRARTIDPGREPAWTMAELLRETLNLNKERSRAPAPRRHAH